MVFFRKMNTFLGMMILWIFFWGHHKLDEFNGHFYALYGHFLGSMRYIFGLHKISNIILGCLIFLICFAKQ